MTPVTTLGVAEAAAEVMRRARDVRIDEAKVDVFCKGHRGAALPVAEWNADLHFSDGPEATANYVLVLDALNFCFWSDPGEPRWTVEYRGAEHQGYWALCAALKRGMEEGVPLLDASWLADASLEDVARLMRGRHAQVPLLDRRHAHLQEAGRVLRDRYGGRFSEMVRASGGDAVDLAARVSDELASFHDVAAYDGLTVPLLKRAQILAVDLYGSFGGRGLGDLRRLDALTAFADYKVPQVLRRLGILVYSEDLARTVDDLVAIPAGDPREVEIRAATVHAVELLRAGLGGVRSFEVDWFLWGLGQERSSLGLPGEEKPYHRTRTVFY